MSIDLAALPAFLQSKSAFVRYLSLRPDLPAIVKTVAVGLALLQESDFVRLRDSFLEIVAALDETPRGRSILLDMGLDKWVFNAADSDSGQPTGIVVRQDGQRQNLSSNASAAGPAPANRGRP